MREMGKFLSRLSMIRATGRFLGLEVLHNAMMIQGHEGKEEK